MSKLFGIIAIVLLIIIVFYSQRTRFEFFHTCNINDFDIRNHKDFYLYVPAESVQRCEGCQNCDITQHPKYPELMAKSHSPVTRPYTEVRYATYQQGQDCRKHFI